MDGITDRLDPAVVGPLLDLLDHPSPVVRTAALEAATRLPLATPEVIRVGRHVATVLHERRSGDELTAVIAATPRVPTRSVREALRRAAIAIGEVPTPVLEAVDDPDAAPSDPAAPVEHDRTGARPDPVAFAVAYRSLAVELWNRSGARTPLVITAFLHRDQSDPARSLCWRIAWDLSRAGLATLLDGLAPILRSRDEDELTAAACLVADAADMEPMTEPPVDGAPGPPVRIGSTEFVDDTEAMDGVPPPNPDPSADDDVQFAVYRPAAVRPAIWYPLLAFAHRTAVLDHPDGGVLDPSLVVEHQARALLAGQEVFYDSVRSDSGGPLPRGSELTFVPWLTGCDINPPRSSLRWEEPVHRVEFHIRAPASLNGSRIRGGLRVYLGVVLIGEVGFRTAVDAAAPRRPPPSPPVTTTRFRKIFASYSHRDAEIVHRLTEFVRTIGDRYLMDVMTLGPGDPWDERLRELIEQADVFQLFWSQNSMRSPFVRREWEHALRLERDGFIRPVYWEDPLPADEVDDLPPAALRRIHFARLNPDLAGVAPAGAARPPARAGAPPPVTPPPSVGYGGPIPPTVGSAAPPPVTPPGGPQAPSAPMAPWPGPDEPWGWAPAEPPARSPRPTWLRVAIVAALVVALAVLLLTIWFR